MNTAKHSSSPDGTVNAGSQSEQAESQSVGNTINRGRRLRRAAFYISIVAGVVTIVNQGTQWWNRTFPSKDDKPISDAQQSAPKVPVAAGVEVPAMRHAELPQPRHGVPDIQTPQTVVTDKQLDPTQEGPDVIPFNPLRVDESPSGPNVRKDDRGNRYIFFPARPEQSKQPAEVSDQPETIIKFGDVKESGIEDTHDAQPMEWRKAG